MSNKGCVFNCKQLRRDVGLCPLTCQHENPTRGEQNDPDQRDDALEQHLKLLSIQFAPQVIDKGVNLTQAKHSKSSHVLGGLDRLQWKRKR